MIALMFLGLVASSMAVPQKRIVGGSAAAAGSHPSQASVQSKGSHMCGGVVVGANKVVTAAHCLSGQNAGDLSVVAGTNSLSGDQGQRVGVASYRIHPDFDGSGAPFSNNIAVITLDGSFSLGRDVAAALLPGQGQEFDGHSCTISGWGYTESGSVSSTLVEASVTAISNSACQGSWGDLISDDHICASGNGASTCNGDSGGPLSCGQYVAGTVTWGYSGCDGSRPSVFTRMSSYSDWVNSS